MQGHTPPVGAEGGGGAYTHRGHAERMSEGVRDGVSERVTD